MNYKYVVFMALTAKKLPAPCASVSATAILFVIFSPLLTFDPSSSYCSS